MNVTTTAEQGKTTVFHLLSSPFAPEISVSRDAGSTVPSHVRRLILHTQAESGTSVAYYFAGSTPSSCFLPHSLDGVDLYRQPPAGQSRVYRVAQLLRTLPIVLPRLKSAGIWSVYSPQGSSSNGCCLFRLQPMDQFIIPHEDLSSR